MKISRMTIRNFGKIHNRTFELSDGINVLYGENESGKTTIHTFLRSMFFGITRQRGRAARNDAYTTYEPWENPADYGGILWFDRGGESFRLTRNFYKERPYHELFSETTGAIADAEKGALENVLGDVSEAVYDNTVSVGQLKSVTGQDLVRELQNYMASYEGTGDSSIDLARAVQLLKMTRKGYQSQEDRRLREIEAEQQKISGSLSQVEKELQQLRDRQASAEEKSRSLRIGSGGEEILDERIREARRQQSTNLFLFLGLFAACLLAAFFLPEFTGLMIFVRIGLGVLGIALLMAGAYRNSRFSREVRKRQKMKARWLSRQEKVLWNRKTGGELMDERLTAYESLQEEYRECEDQKYARSEDRVEIDALTLALDTIGELSGQITNQVGAALRRRTSQILSEITGGKYNEILMDQNLHMTVNTGERIGPLERLSRGTLEQIYFALRMAAGELLCGKEPFPVILDDVFGMYDEERLLGVLRWLYEADRQIIISTCSKREMEILDREGIPYQGLLL